MKFGAKKIGGALLIIGVVQFVVFLLFSESIYPNYSISNNYISDLGVGQTAQIFNSSIILLGLFIIIAGFYLKKVYNDLLLLIAAILIGAGAMGIGLFPENTGIVHTIASAVLFVVAGISAIGAYRIEKWPLNYISAVLGIVSLAAAVLFQFTNINFGVGIGGMENLIVWPILIWGFALGIYLVTASEKRK